MAVKLTETPKVCEFQPEVGVSLKLSSKPCTDAFILKVDKKKMRGDKGFSFEFSHPIFTRKKSSG